MQRNASSRKYSCLQRFCILRKDAAKHLAAFARRRSGVRIPSAPLWKYGDLQVERSEIKKDWVLSQPFLTTVEAALGEYVFHDTCGMVSHPRDHVRIGVQRDRHGGVAQEFLDVLGMYVTGQ